jgi:transposase-like protein
MDPHSVFCPNPDCPARGQLGKDNIRVHSWKEQRYHGRVCDQTFAARKGTTFYRLRTADETVTRVVTRLADGCPVAAIVQAFGLDERTVRAWWQRAGQHCRAVHECLVQAQSLDWQQVQADEIRVKTQSGVYSRSVALAIMVSTRLGLGGVVSAKRDLDLIEALAHQVRQMARCRPWLLAVDGLVS